jgi:CheY-like chemotaxis protein
VDEANRDGVVLIVDDDESTRETLEEALKSDGYETAVASDGEEALGWLSHHPPPRLMLLDLLMPGMDGWQVIDHLRQRDELPHVPIAVITAVGRDLRNAAEYPALRKPIEIDELLSLVERQRAA